MRPKNSPRAGGWLVLFALLSACAQATSPLPTNSPSPTTLPTLAPTPTPSPTARPPETISIDTPAFQQEISGGTLIITGYSEYFFESNLSVTICGFNFDGSTLHHICGSENNILAEGYATIDSPDMGFPGPYAGTLAYTVSEPTKARVVVYAVSPMDGAVEHLTSVIVTLMP